MDYRADPAPTQIPITDAERRSLALQRALALLMAFGLGLVTLVLLSAAVYSLSTGHPLRGLKILFGGIFSVLASAAFAQKERARELLRQSQRGPALPPG